MQAPESSLGGLFEGPLTGNGRTSPPREQVRLQAKDAPPNAGAKPPAAEPAPQPTNGEPYPRQWTGKLCSFDHEGKRLTGTVIAQEYIGRTARGSIPNYRLTVKGRSGAILTVDLVEQYASFI